MTTQLIIDGIEVVLPQKFSTTVKRENSFFTKSGEYTYDCTLNLDNPTNCQLYKFLQRLNSIEEIENKRSAVLIADGHVYCRGTEVITKWTEHTVTIQIVSGESELNYFIGQDKKIEDLDLGRIFDSSVLDWCYDTEVVYPDVDFCLATVRRSDGVILNDEVVDGKTGKRYCKNPVAQPYLCALIRRIVNALGYNKDHEMVNQLDNTIFKNLFIVNTINTLEYAKMLPGWTVKDFMTEVEKLTGVVFLTNNLNKTCDIVLKTQFYQNASQFTIHDVVDAYEMEVLDDDSREAEFTNSNISYDIPNHRQANIMKTPKSLLDSTDVKMVDIDALPSFDTYNFSSVQILHHTESDRYYIGTDRSDPSITVGVENIPQKFYIELNQFKDYTREDTTSELTLKITPAPLTHLGYILKEVIDLGSTDGYSLDWSNLYSHGNATDYGESTEEEEEETSIEDKIREYSEKDSSQCDLYAAFFYRGTVDIMMGDVYITTINVMLAYTDWRHAANYSLIYGKLLYGNTAGISLDDKIAGQSLRLNDLADDYFQGSYQIDTSHVYTIETYDPNVIDPRQVYVIRNKRYVCRDVEEVITNEGRQKKWKGNFFPIHLSDEALEKRWVLTHGVWDDHAAWLDDGRWNDNYDGAPV